jgi:hypothetical protein
MQYEVVSWITGDRIEALKMAASKRMSGNLDDNGVSKRVTELPVFELKDGRTIIIGADFIGVLKEYKEGDKDNG